MRPDIDTPLRRQTRAALAALEQAVPLGPVGPDAAAVTLERIGDALRLEIALPGALRSWTSACPEADLVAVVQRARAELEALVLPISRAGLDPSVTGLALRRRDAAESTRTALVRTCLARGIAPVELDGFLDLCDAALRFDSALAGIATREDVELWLEDRAELLGERPWTSALPTAPDVAIPSSGEPARELELPDELDLSSDVVASYAAVGAHAELVRRATMRDPAFADELADTMDALRSVAEPVSLEARRWLRTHRAQAADPVAIPALPRERVAAATARAATEEPEATATSVSLGTLWPLDAIARIGASRTLLTLHVYPGLLPLASVTFGAATATEPDADGDWSVTLEATDEPLRLRVVASDGRSFDELVRLTAAEAEEPA